MEKYLSLIAVLISFITLIISAVIYVYGVRRDRKQATLDAYNRMSEQVFDKLTNFTKDDIVEICKLTKELHEGKSFDKFTEVQQQKIDKYHELGGYLARIEHFALGVNTKIYDAEVAHRAGTMFLKTLYEVKLKPLIEYKNSFGKGKVEYYKETRLLVEKIKEIESKEER